MRLVVAIGGNALLTRGEELSAENQRRNMGTAALALAEIMRDHEVILVHGNGPQVGLLALESAAFKDAPVYPLDVLGAESQGMIGYIIEQELRNVMPERRIVTLLTQTVVDASDPAFEHPTKPIGPIYSEAEARELTATRGWSIAPDGKNFRRVVPSPLPVDMLERQTIDDLVGAGVVVICAGGGGVPVTLGDDKKVSGIEAVIDKDLAASLLARTLKADRLIILTDVDAVYRDWGKDTQQRIDKTDPASLRNMDFAKGSMGPKVDAVCRFVEATGNRASIGSLSQAADVVSGKAGTHIQT
ncbi:MAG: carbamate kinase [Parvibaculum sp.]